MAEAVGMLEVFGLATAFAAADAGCKAGNVWLENFDKNKPGNADELPVPLPKRSVFLLALSGRKALRSLRQC